MFLPYPCPLLVLSRLDPYTRGTGDSWIIFHLSFVSLIATGTAKDWMVQNEGPERDVIILHLVYFSIFLFKTATK